MITSSLLKDAKDKNEANKIDAFKLLPYVINQNNPVQSEQLFKGVGLDYRGDLRQEHRRGQRGHHGCELGIPT